MKSFTALLLLTIVLAYSTNAQQAGSLDNSFDADGKVTISAGQGNSFAKAVALQADGKIVVTGIASNGANNDFTTLRFLANGKPDSTFNGTGMQMTDFNQLENISNSIAIRPSDGRIITGGYSDNSTGFDFAVAMYNTDGTPANGFGTFGKVITPFSSNSFGNAAAFQQDGKILLAGYTLLPSGNSFAVARYNDDGSADTTFSQDGKVTTIAGTGNSVAYCMSVQTDGKIVLAGNTFNDTLLRWDPCVIRYNIDGSPDAGFGNNGIVILPGNNADDFISAIAMQADGKIVLAGYSGTSSANNNFMLVRLQADGSADTSFGAGGILTSFFGLQNNQATSVLVQPDGKIIAGGFSNTGNNDQFALIRFDAAGNPDPSFGTAGKTTTVLGGNDGIVGMVMQLDGKIIAAGTSFTGNGFNMALARYYAFVTTGTSDNFSAEKSLEVFPNPVLTDFTVSYTIAKPELVTLRLLDVSGRVLITLIERSRQEAGKHTLHATLPYHFQSGIYFIKLYTDAGISMIKIIK
jgi:uncharacterized delta-60 repeat protein